MDKNQGIVKSFKGFLKRWISEEKIRFFGDRVPQNDTSHHCHTRASIGPEYPGQKESNILPWTLGSSPRVTQRESRVTVIPPHNFKRGPGGAYTNPQHTQSGRSMTEMLGVLAVMAVLTIGGIAGYNYAMNKHRSNMILNDVRRIAVFVLSSKFLEQDDGSLVDLDVEVESMTPYEVVKETDKTFYVTAGEVNKRICNILMADIPAYAEDVVANVMGTKTCGEDDNEVYFYVNAKGDDSPSDQKCTLECTNGMECVGEVCMCPTGRITCGETCCGEKDKACTTFGACVNCTSNDDCKENEYCKANKLVSESNQSGSCTKIKIAAQFIYNGIEYIYPQGDYYYADAKQVCQRLGKRMANRTDITEDIREELWRRANGTAQGFYTDEIYNAAGIMWCYKLETQRFYTCAQDWPMSALCI